MFKVSISQSAWQTCILHIRINICLMLKYPNIDPVIVQFTDKLAVRWYSLAYIAGFFLVSWFFKKQNKKFHILDEKYCETILFYGMAGLIIGARLFDCLFYNFMYTLHNPLSIFAVWNGGMSFHGGLIGLFIGIITFAKKYKVKINAIRFLDICVVVIPFALMLGRIANFINGELYGNISYTSPFAMIFPTDPEQFPRHPSQIYEALTEGLLLLTIMLILFYKTKLINKTGTLSGIFCFLYAIFRFVCEFFREPEIGNLLGLTAGQHISIGMLVFSIVWIYFWKKH